MAAGTLTERYAANLHGVLSCFDRLIITGTLPGACYAGGMTSFLYAHDIRIFDYPRFAEPLRDRIRERAQEVCAAADIEIEHARTSHIRKEALVANVLAVRGDAPGLVHIRPDSNGIEVVRGTGVRIVLRRSPPRATRNSEQRSPG